MSSLTGQCWCCSLFRNITEIEKLSELGVLFLLFEMGLELSLDRLKVSQPWKSPCKSASPCTRLLLLTRAPPCAQALAKYAFGLGLLQMVFSTAAFTLFSLPVGAGIGTVILEKVIITHSPSNQCLPEPAQPLTCMSTVLLRPPAISNKADNMLPGKQV